MWSPSYPQKLAACPLCCPVSCKKITEVQFNGQNTGIDQPAKHVDIQYHFVNDMAQKGDLSLVHITSDENPSNVMIKILQYALHVNKDTTTVTDGRQGTF